MDPKARYLSSVEAEMRRVVAPQAKEPSLLYNMLSYHLGWVDEDFQLTKNDSGKRVRPLLLLLANEAQGGDWQQAVPAAAAIELLHNFTLIHDDIEDRDEVRRGRTTLWALWGVPQAINAGDALFALAYWALLGLAAHAIPLERQIQAQARYTDTVIRLTEGQCRDLMFESEDVVDEAAYLEMIKGKTAALLGLCCELGGLLAGAPLAQTAALRRFGEALGMAFQMQDDLLGLWGDPAMTGKPVGSDLIKRKKTLPILHGMATDADLQALLLKPDLDAADVPQALERLERCGSRAYTEQAASTFHEAALAALTASKGTGAAHDELQALAARLLQRHS